MRLFVPLTREEFDRLRQVARDQRRRPQDQAAVLIIAQLPGTASAESAPRADAEGSSVQTPAERHRQVNLIAREGAGGGDGD